MRYLQHQTTTDFFLDSLCGMKVALQTAAKDLVTWTYTLEGYMVYDYSIGRSDNRATYAWTHTHPIWQQHEVMNELCHTETDCIDVQACNQFAGRQCGS